LPPGPKITFFGVATAADAVVTPVDETAEGIPIYTRPTRSGFKLVIEARPGASNRQPSTFGTMDAPASPPDRAAVQIQANRPLGDGSPAVCDRGPDPPIGGVPAVNPVDFGPSEAVSAAIDDLACRLDVHNTSSTACTLNQLGVFSFVADDTTIQFCTAPALGMELALQPGETMFTAQLVDTGGNIGNRLSIIISVPSD
jgi:hypothetical protein